MHTVVRRVLPHEYSKYRIHLKSLDTESRILRFGHNASDFSIDKLCDEFELNHANHELFCIENKKLEFIAIGHISTCGTMELAFSVLKEFQGKGLGNRLMIRCIQYCRTRRILSGEMMCLAHNRVIRHLCTKHGITMQTSQGETIAAIELPKADLSTYVQEGVDMNIAALDFLSKRASYHLTTILE